MICLTTTAPDPWKARESIEVNRQWIDLVELRVDQWDLSGQELFPRAAALLAPAVENLPVILTLRRESDGGGYTGGEARRVELLHRALEELTPAWVDLEDDLLAREEGRALLEAAGRIGTRVIRSIHDFSSTPEDLPERLMRLDEAPGDVSKYAVATRRTADLLTLYRAAAEAASRRPGRERVLIGMGEFGVPSRLLPSAFGSRWSYASPAGGRPGAPGQLTPQELVERFAFREAAAGAPLFAILGNPALHSGSPAYHNRRFRESGIRGAYLAFPADDLDPALEMFDLLSLRGVSVTIPFKERVVAHLRDREGAVEALGAANTLTRRPAAADDRPGAAEGPGGGERPGAPESRGGWYGTNTDVTGFLKPLLPELSALSGLRALVIGAGGAARAVVYALLKEGARLTVANRSVQRAEKLLDALGGKGTVLGLDDESLLREPFDLIVQTTSVGMDGVSEPLPGLPVTAGCVVYDIIYTPPETPLILRARAAGARVITGDRMFEAQAEAQFALFRTLAIEGA